MGVLGDGASDVDRENTFKMWQGRDSDLGGGGGDMGNVP